MAGCDGIAEFLIPSLINFSHITPFKKKKAQVWEVLRAGVENYRKCCIVIEDTLNLDIFIHFIMLYSFDN